MSQEPSVKERPAELARGAQLDALASQKKRSLLGEFLSFLLHNKKWWLAPLVLALLLLGAIVALGGTAAAPFIYTLF